LLICVLLTHLFSVFPRKLTNFREQKYTIVVSGIIHHRYPDAVDMFITAFRQDSGICSVSYNFGVARSDSLVIDVSNCHFSVRFISDSNF